MECNKIVRTFKNKYPGDVIKLIDIMFTILKSITDQ